MNRRLVQHLSSLEFFHRKNTLAIDLSPIQGRENRPNRKEMFSFITKQLGLKEEEIVAIQHHAFVPQVFLKVQSEDILGRVETKLLQGTAVNGKTYMLFGWRCDKPLTTVRINNITPETSKEEIEKIMGKYCKVKTCEMGVYECAKTSVIYDGTWLLRVWTEPGKGLPSVIYYNPDESDDKVFDVWSLNFDGKVSCCWKCGGEDHIGDRCRARRPKLDDRGDVAPVGVGTYSDIVRRVLM